MPWPLNQCNEVMPCPTPVMPIKNADSGSELIQLVSFNLDNEYGVEVLKVREIIRTPESGVYGIPYYFSVTPPTSKIPPELPPLLLVSIVPNKTRMDKTK
jgi:hypothetical protein